MVHRHQVQGHQDQQGNAQCGSQHCTYHYGQTVAGRAGWQQHSPRCHLSSWRYWRATAWSLAWQYMVCRAAGSPAVRHALSSNMPAAASSSTPSICVLQRGSSSAAGGGGYLRKQHSSWLVSCVRGQHKRGLEGLVASREDC